MGYFMSKLAEGLGSRADSFSGMDVMTLAGRYRPVWKEDKLLRSELDVRVARIQYLTGYDIAGWEMELSAFSRSKISNLWIIGMLIDIDRLFTKDGFDKAQSEILLGRLKNLQGDLDLAGALKLGGAWSAILIIQNDDFFVKDGFRQQVFDNAKERLKARLTDPKK